jgi:hypothetical protein
MEPLQETRIIRSVGILVCLGALFLPLYSYHFSSYSGDYDSVTSMFDQWYMLPFSLISLGIWAFIGGAIFSLWRPWLDKISFLGWFWVLATSVTFVTFAGQNSGEYSLGIGIPVAFIGVLLLFVQEIRDYLDSPVE